MTASKTVLKAAESPRTVRVGLVQARDRGSPEANLAHTVERIREAAANGARIVCTQELFLTRYFCRTQNPALFDLAEPVPGPTTEALSALAAELDLVLVASLFERRASGVYHNTAAVIDADGSLLGKYRKMHIPQDPGFEEKFYFTPGDLGFRAWKTRHGTIGVIICWDQWFPEAARLTALAGAEILFCPTAIGWLPEEKAELGAAQHTAWETVQRGHAVANGCYLAAVNRTGTEGETEFWGQSFVADPYGQVAALAPVEEEAVLLADCDLAALEDTRRIWPFFRDRRIDAYGDLTRRLADGD
jgi:N-carbamoylputrescine amidase